MDNITKYSNIYFLLFYEHNVRKTKRNRDQGYFTLTCIRKIMFGLTLAYNCVANNTKYKAE